MLSYILRRLLLMIPTLIGILTITFVVTQFVPGGPVDQIIQQLRGTGGEGSGIGGIGAAGRGREISAHEMAELKKQYGFDKPPLERYGEMMWNFAHFDLGRSFIRNQSVASLIVSKLPVSISLGMWSFLLSYLISIPLGIAKARRAGTRFDLISTIIVLIGFAIPGLLLGVLLIVLFAGGTFLEWFPLRGLVSDNWSDLSWPARIVDYFHHLALPIICYTIGSFAVLTLLTKNTFLEEIRRQYVQTARAKGLTDRQVLIRHVLRNALIPIVTGLPAALVGAFFGGALLIETLFSLDGLGLLSYESIIRRDFPVVLGSLYLFSLIGLVIKLVSDVLYVVVDPRLSFEAVRR